MTEYRARISLRDGQAISFRVIGEDLPGLGKPESRWTEQDLAMAACRHGFDVGGPEIESFVVAVTTQLDDREVPAHVTSEQGSTSDHSVERCRSALVIAGRLLPGAVRNEAVDEWLDEIECAASAQRGVTRRTASILIRTLPALVWRSRRPMYVRGRGN